MKITQERLKEILTYDEVTGNFYWNIDKGKQKAGTKAGQILQSGYVLIGLDGKYISFGHFDSKSDAIIVSRMVRELHHKEFARHV